MGRYKNKMIDAFEYVTLFILIVVLGTLHASFLTWVIVSILYIAATALTRRAFESWRNGDDARPTI